MSYGVFSFKFSRQKSQYRAYYLSFQIRWKSNSENIQIFHRIWKKGFGNPSPFLKKLGKGQFTFGTGNRTGDTYDGDFYQGEFHGNGTYTYANGDRFVGQFRFGKRNGVGTLYKHDGETIPGRWRNGHLVAEVV